MAYQRRVQGEQSIIMNADDAEARNIEEGQPVRVFNENGEIHGIARIGAGDPVARGVVVCPLGHWRKVEGGADRQRHHPHGLRRPGQRPHVLRHQGGGGAGLGLTHRPGLGPLRSCTW